MKDKTNIAKLNGKSLQISTKISVEICNAIRNKNLIQVKRILQDAADLKRAIPIKRYNWNLGHKSGMAAGRYPVKASNVFLKLCKSLEANAENKGLNVSNLVLIHAKADKAEAKWHYTKKGRTKMKNTHIELIAEEISPQKKEVVKK